MSSLNLTNRHPYHIYIVSTLDPLPLWVLSYSVLSSWVINVRLHLGEASGDLGHIISWSCWILWLFAEGDQIHLLKVLVYGLLLVLKAQPCLGHLRQSLIDHATYRQDVLLCRAVDICTESQIPQSHQLKDSISDCFEGEELSMVLWLSRVSFFQSDAKLVSNWLALDNKDEESLHHGVHFFHNLETCLARCPSTMIWVIRAGLVSIDFGVDVHHVLGVEHLLMLQVVPVTV